MPFKKLCITKPKIQSSGPMTQFLPGSSSPTSTSIDLTSSPSPPTTSVSTSRMDSGKTSYIWNHGKKIVREGQDRWQCNHCRRSYAMSASKATTNQREHLNMEHGIPDPRAPIDTKQST